MLRSLRGRMIFSHLLPLLLVLPIIGLLLTYWLNTQVILAEYSDELERQAELVAIAASSVPQIWYDPEVAQLFVEQIKQKLPVRVMLLDPQGHLLASTDSADQSRIGQKIDVPYFDEVVLTHRVVRVGYDKKLPNDAAEVLIPVTAGLWQLVGVIRLIDPLSNVYTRFAHTRTFILGIVMGGLTVGFAVGWRLAVDLERPLRHATEAITQMAAGQPLRTLPEQGPEEVRLLVRAFNTLTRQLRMLERTRTRLLANLVHELGRPLGALLSATQALAAGAVADPNLRQELLAGMEGEIRRTHRLLDDLTHLYDKAVGPLALHRRPTPLSVWLPAALSPWREAAQEKGLAWDTDIPADLPRVLIDPDRMAQALGNIVSNAIKYTPEGGSVAVLAGTTDKVVWISVQDTGPGIAPEEQARIFIPFYRSAASSRFPQGMGLGLSIARDLITAHGGHITLKSAPGHGSDFTLWIPLEDAPQPAALPAAD